MIRRNYQHVPVLIVGLPREPLWPLDNVPTATEPAEIARQISEINCAMVRRSSTVIADISPFRGPNTHPGIAFEIGYAAALNQPIFLYSSSSQSLLDRTISMIEVIRDGSKRYDVAGMEVEDFDLSENLMIGIALRKSRRRHGRACRGIESVRRSAGGISDEPGGGQGVA